MQRAGDAVQINVQLIDVETDEHLWAETYNRQLTAENIFAIQADMATSIAEALQATLSPQELDTLNRVPTQSLVPVPRLALDGMLFEVDAIAVLY